MLAQGSSLGLDQAVGFRIIEKLRTLLDAAGPSLGADLTGPPELPDHLRANELRELLLARNGFLAFGGALHVLPWDATMMPLALRCMELGRPLARVICTLANGHFFFAEDAFGFQFSLFADSVHRFDPETGDSEEFSATIEDWLAIVLRDHRVLTGWPLLADWEALNGELPYGHRLFPKVPFVTGGEFTPENLAALESVEGMRLRGALALQLHDLADGTRVRYTASDDPGLHARGS